MVQDLLCRASISLSRVSEHLAFPKVSVEDSAAATALPRDECTTRHVWWPQRARVRPLPALRTCLCSSAVTSLSFSWVLPVLGTPGALAWRRGEVFYARIPCKAWTRRGAVRWEHHLPAAERRPAAIPGDACLCTLIRPYGKLAKEKITGSCKTRR